MRINEQYPHQPHLHFKNNFPPTTDIFRIFFCFTCLNFCVFLTLSQFKSPFLVSFSLSLFSLSSYLFLFTLAVPSPGNSLAAVSVRQLLAPGTPPGRTANTARSGPLLDWFGLPCFTSCVASLQTHSQLALVFHGQRQGSDIRGVSNLYKTTFMRWNGRHEKWALSALS